MHPLLPGLKDAVARLYQRNRQTGRAGWCGHDYDFVCPSTGTYPFQWFWDSCFHAVVLARLDPSRAESELRSLLRNAQPDGFIAHVTFWQREAYEHLLKNYCIAYRTPYLSDCVQPPVLAEAVAEVARAGGGTAFLREVLPAVRRYYDWLDRERDPDRDGLIAVLLPDETGLDHTPKFDDYLGIPGTLDLAAFDEAWARVARAYHGVSRVPAQMFALDRFIVEDVMTCSIYGRNQRILAELLEQVGDAGGAAELRERAERTTRGLVEKCRDPATGLFFDLAGAAEQPLRVSTFTCLFPLLLEDLPGELAAPLLAQLRDPRCYRAPYPVPTVSMSEPSFAPSTVGTRLLWRGPTWMNVNWLLWRGLQARGEAELAGRIAEQSARLVDAHGFREYYNPLTGEGLGAEGFSFAALALVMLEDV
jgi:glycogen debranching enzyme